MEWATGWKPEPSAETGALKDIFNGFRGCVRRSAVAIGPGVVESFGAAGSSAEGLCSRYGFVVGILLTSCLFAAMHMNPARF